MSALLQILLIMIFVSISTAVLGSFLVLKGNAMLVDAISHTILLGIVLAFFLVEDLNSPLLILGAALVGLLTVFLVQYLENTGLVSRDAAIGIVFPLLFSIAILLIALNASSVHLDVDTVLLGKVELAPFDFIQLNGKNIGAKSIYIMAIVSLINIAFVLFFFKELKVSTFDPAYAVSLGMATLTLNYLFMALVSITAVASFQAVGSILVIAYMVGPSASAYLLSRNLKKMVFLSIGIGIIDSILGTVLAFIFDFSIAGTTATVIGVVFLLIFLFAPREGYIARKNYRNQQSLIFKRINLLYHLHHHRQQGDLEEECHIKSMNRHLRLEEALYQSILKELKDLNYIYIEDNIVNISETGETYLENKIRELGLLDRNILPSIY